MSWNFERVAGPFKGRTGGLAWNGKTMLFSAVIEERVLSFDPVSGKTDVFRKWTGRTNGIAVAEDGSVYGAQEGCRRVVHFELDGTTSPTADLVDGQHHNQPTDLIVDSKGRVWFADPHNPMTPYGPPIYKFLDVGSVLRLERDERRAWKVKRVTFDTKEPRAVLLSPDEKTLYVAEGDQERGVRCELRAYPLEPDGSVGRSKVLQSFGANDRGIEGMCLDSDGNIVACGGSRQSGPGPLIYVFSPSGAVIETQPAPDDAPMKCAFGDAGLGSFYVTTGGGHLYRAKGIGRRGFAR